MKTAEFDYLLPEELIAQVPSSERSASRLMVFNRKTSEVEHTHFNHLRDLIPPEDLLVINSSKVIPARLYTVPKSGEMAREILFIKKLTENKFSAMVRPGKKFKMGAQLPLPENKTAEVLDILPDGLRVLSIAGEDDPVSFFRRNGEMPLPPYITSRESSPERYQTVFSGMEGSIAAPTAGLHFDQTLMAKIKDSGVRIEDVVLHVGIGTFKPVEVENIHDHQMHSEEYFISQRLADEFNNTRARGGKIWACGTTSARTLESSIDSNGKLQPGYNETSIFISPGYRFKAIDHLITNFHLPKSTLIMLVSAFAGREKVLELYKIAIEMKYRFYSFGDAMLII
ncbi:MAG: tRNA preQ1(34) S-adenosylmethionine ribosyltransferase-isomerase QueA [Candidatus Riflebacteria bacterium]|nr:tRNA preQ1(34) S-adenosylmethionine ribosyltransferase-isomerase QueA [Candidatus Riflebacteria bacterium]